ncbi:chemotaxis protein CheB [Cryobacterium fucosi]|uniref:protein-glutamate methylesterase n=1 Tax=Cryobacterium fucosi TaxID=1259157 RepID=A0A4R9B4S2_9MICO|nr:chemotaxis protein CheB [Cryobacterium fucosi]TFD76036.1 response regulator [Cryobacterium fucosi]
MTGSAAAPRSGKSIRVLIIDDLPTDRARLARTLQSDGDIVSLGQVATGQAAIGLVAREHPDVILLGLSTTDGSGQSLIEQVMAHTPTPILVLSTQIENRQSPGAVDALVAGALDVLPGPVRWTPDLEAGLRRTVRQLSRVQTIRHPRGVLARPPGVVPAPSGRTRQTVVALAASTGGPKALATVLAGLGGLAAPVLVVQHLHQDFTGGLVDWMTRVSALPVEIAVHDQVARPGRVYLAPGGLHLRLGAGLRLELASTPVTIHQPSANELFQSVARNAGSAGVGVILTGMGDDGAEGLLEMHRANGQTLGQDEESCAVFGMPRAAYRVGAVSDLLSVDLLAAAILRCAARGTA